MAFSLLSCYKIVREKGNDDMDLEEKALESTRIYDGAILNVRKDIALLPDGRTAPREVVEHPGGVGIALEDEEGKFFMVTQWRYGQRKVMTEFPAGKKEKGEEPLVTAKREIIEETGYEGLDFVHLGKLVPTPAYDEEVIDLYYARKGRKLGQHLDDDEYLNVTRMSLNEIIDGIMNGTIDDAKTVAMAFMIREYKERTNEEH